MTARRNRVLAPVLLALFAAILGVKAAFAEASRCAVPDDIAGEPYAVPRFAEALKREGAIRLLVMGTASSGGGGVSAPAKAYPAILERALQERMPGRDIRVAVSAARGRQAQQMAAEAGRLVAQQKAVLVIWQTGTVEAVRSAALDVFGEALGDGIAAARAGGADVVLMNMQFGPQAAVMIDYDPYLVAMEQAAQGEEVNLFRRFELMRYWIEEGQIVLPTEPGRADTEAADQVHDCIGTLLADMIDKAAKAAP